MITHGLAEFGGALPNGGRLAGLDVGAKTIGIALCDVSWMIATPTQTLKRAKFAADLVALEAFVEAQAVRGLVIGYPRNLDGSESPRTQATRAFARNLAPLDLPILLWDERWSTQAVTRTLIDADTRRSRRAQVVDKMAAAFILQGAIDALAGIG